MIVEIKTKEQGKKILLLHFWLKLELCVNIQNVYNYENHCLNVGLVNKEFGYRSMFQTLKTSLGKSPT